MVVVVELLSHNGLVGRKHLGEELQNSYWNRRVHNQFTLPYLQAALCSLLAILVAILG